jgi:hypothetical protein
LPTVRSAYWDGEQSAAARVTARPSASTNSPAPRTSGSNSSVEVGGRKEVPSLPRSRHDALGR